MALESLPGENRSPRSRLMTNQVREWRRNQGRGKRIPEAGRWDTRRNRNRLQGKLLLHRPRRQRPHRQLGRRRERIPSHRWSPAHSATDARTRRQASGWLESRWCPRISHNWFQDDPSTSPPLCFYDFLLINNIRWIYFYFVSRIHLFFFLFEFVALLSPMARWYADDASRLDPHVFSLGQKDLSNFFSDIQRFGWDSVDWGGDRRPRHLDRSPPERMWRGVRRSFPSLSINYTMNAKVTFPVFFCCSIVQDRIAIWQTNFTSFKKKKGENRRGGDR